MNVHDGLRTSKHKVSKQPSIHRPFHLVSKFTDLLWACKGEIASVERA